MNFWTNVLIFIIVLIFYMHLQNEWKKGDDLEIYEMDYISNSDLQETCKLKQPVIFQIPNLELSSLDDKIDVHIKDIRDYYKAPQDTKSISGIQLSYKSAHGLCSSDPKGHFFSENNSELVDTSKYDDFSKFIVPPLTVHKKYDYLFGSKRAYTPARYHTDSALYLHVLSGSGIRCKMAPWRANAYMKPVKDYENYDFWSRIDLWKDPLRTLEFDLKPGYTLYIPPYWFYTIEFLGDEENTAVSAVASFRYITAMNIVANLQHYGLYFLQQQNTRYMNFNSVKEVREVHVGEQEDTPSEMESPSSSLQMDSSSNVTAISSSSSSQKQQIDSMLSVITVK
jgi:hypothetical protein